MNIIDDVSDILEQAKEKTKDLELGGNLEGMKNDIIKATQKAVDKTADYIIKAMPVPDAVKDILKDVKDAIKTKSFKDVLSTAVTSTIREGLEILGFDKNQIKDIYNLKDIAMKGGLLHAIKGGIEIIANNYLKNNIVGQHIYDFFHKLKNFVLNNSFSEQINKMLQGFLQKKERFFEKCSEWYGAYDKMDLDAINTTAKKIASKKEIINQYGECAKENRIIQNMTKMINSKNEKLTENQLQLCKAL